jgi:1-acyl-sn-glycerol-3-phosphate acyltransferase
MYKLVRTIVRFFMHIIARVEVHGLENMPEANFILAVNHLGRLDTAVLLYAVDRPDIILPIAEKYRHHPLFGLLGRSMNAVWLNRFEADYAALREILKRMEQGGLMVIAPEGTRSKTEALQEGKMGAAFLAGKSGYPVLPVALTGTEDRLVLQNLKHFRRSRILAVTGKPFHIRIPNGRGREQAMREATEEIMCRIAALLPETYRGFYADHPRLKELEKYGPVKRI